MGGWAVSVPGGLSISCLVRLRVMSAAPAMPMYSVSSPWGKSRPRTLKAPSTTWCRRTGALGAQYTCTNKKSIVKNE